MVPSSMKDLMVFIMDEGTMRTFTAGHGVKLGAQSELTLGPLGRSYQFDANLTSKNVGSTVAIAFSKGAFVGLSVTGAILGPRDVTNNYFYGRDITTEEILYGKNVILPQDKVTLLEEVYDKLGKLSQGTELAVLESAAVVEEKKKKAHAAAEAAGEATKNDPDIVHVDAAAEAAKESSS